MSPLADRRASRAGAIALLAAFPGAILGVSATEARTRGASPVARAAKVISVKEYAKLHLLEAIGETLVEQGAVTGSLPGSVKGHIDVNATEDRATASFNLALHGGTISGHASGEVHEGKNSRESFSGSISGLRGTGHYAHVKASGKMTLYGAIDRVNDAAELQVIGRLRV